jgi:hypothetical protein
MDKRQLLRKETETAPNALIEEILRFVKALKERNLPALIAGAILPVFPPLRFSWVCDSKQSFCKHMKERRYAII